MTVLGRLFDQSLRFPDKPSLATRLDVLDVAEWLRQVPGDRIAVVSANVWRADGAALGRRDLRVSAPRLSGTAAIGVTFVDGVERTDYIALIGVVAASGRSEFFAVSLYITPILPPFLNS